MKELTLNQTWTQCLRMWKWIASVWKERNDVKRLKIIWLRDHGYVADDFAVFYNCFFCEHAAMQRPFGKNYPVNYDLFIKGGGCRNCPGRLVDSQFDCENVKYHYLSDPKRFYKELLRLNKIRKGKLK